MFINWVSARCWPHEEKLNLFDENLFDTNWIRLDRTFAVEVGFLDIFSVCSAFAAIACAIHDLSSARYSLSRVSKRHKLHWCSWIYACKNRRRGKWVCVVTVRHICICAFPCVKSCRRPVNYRILRVYTCRTSYAGCLMRLATLSHYYKSHSPVDPETLGLHSTSINYDQRPTT